MALPELIDVGGSVELGEVLLALGSLLVWVGALICAALAVAIVETILWPLNKVVQAATLGLLSGVPGAHEVEQFFTSKLGDAAHNVDAAAGSFWHGLKTLAVQVGDEILGLAILGAYMWYWAATKLPTIIWHRFGSALHAGVRHAQAIAKAAERDALHAEHYATSRVRAIDRRLAAIEHSAAGVLEPELRSTRELAKEAEQLAENAWKYLRSKTFTNWVTGIAEAAVAAAGVLAFDFLKCAEWRRLGSTLTCGMGQFLLDLLEGAIAVMVVADICDITKAAIDVLESSEVQDFLTHVESSLTDLVACQGVDLPPTLTGPYYAPPPAQPYAALAA